MSLRNEARALNTKLEEAAEEWIQLNDLAYRGPAVHDLDDLSGVTFVVYYTGHYGGDEYITVPWDFIEAGATERSVIVQTEILRKEAKQLAEKQAQKENIERQERLAYERLKEKYDKG